MSRKFLVILGILVVLSLITTTVFAVRMRLSIAFSSATPTPTPGPGGSLITSEEPEMSADVDFVPDLPVEPQMSANVEVSPGFLTANGSVIGVGNQDVNLSMTATANVQAVNCRNQGGSLAPGQNPPKKITFVGTQTLSGGQSSDKNGKTPFDVIAGGDLQAQFDGVCPNDNWDVIVQLCYVNANVTIPDPSNPDTPFLNKDFPFPLGKCN